MIFLKTSIAIFLINFITILIVFIFYIKSRFIASLDKKYCKCENLKFSDTKNYKERIINGRNLSELDLTSFAVIYDQDVSKQIYKGKNYTKIKFYIVCGGVVISPFWVLTAASCIYPSPKKLFAGAGLNHNAFSIIQQEENLRHIIYSFIYPGYQYSKLKRHFLEVYNELYNFGLARLEHPFEFNKVNNIYPACLLDIEKYDFENDFLMPGYGRQKQIIMTNPSEEKKSNYSTRKVSTERIKDFTQQPSYSKETIKIFYLNSRKVGKDLFNESVIIEELDTSLDPNPKLTTFKQKNCLDPFLSPVILDENLICAINPFSAGCKNDIGSPLYYYYSNKLYVAGIFVNYQTLENATAKMLCMPNSSMEFSTVYPKIKWIKELVGSNNLCLTNPFKFKKNEILVFITLMLSNVFCLVSFSYYNFISFYRG